MNLHNAVEQFFCGTPGPVFFRFIRLLHGKLDAPIQLIAGNSGFPHRVIEIASASAAGVDSELFQNLSNSRIPIGKIAHKAVRDIILHDSPF